MKMRSTKQADIPALQNVLDGTELFPSEYLPDMVSGFLTMEDSSDVWLTCEAGDEPVGFCYAMPEQFTEGTWNMLAIAVLPSQQGGGCGAGLVAKLEQVLRDKGGRILIADTSGTEDFAQTRHFYKRNGYSEEARIRDFWGPGDDKVTFWKSLT